MRAGRIYMNAHSLPLRRRTLEELDRIFSVPNSTFIKYQTKVALPHFISTGGESNRIRRFTCLILLSSSFSHAQERC